MISNNIKNIFSFLEFLHLNIEHFNNQKPLLDEISQVRKEYYDLDPKINYQHTFLRKVLREKEDKLEERFYNECRKAIREKAIELNIIDLNDRFGSGFIHIGEFLILVTTQDYDRNDVEIILRAKDNYISLMTSITVNLDRFLTYGIIRDFKDDLFDCFKPFLTDSDKEILGKFKNFDDFLKFCEPQLKNFQLQNDSLEIIKPFEEKLSNAISDEQINDVKTVAEFGIAKTESMITNFIDRENIKMNFQDIKKIENDTVLEAISLYYNYQKLFYEAKNKSDVLESDKLHFETFPEFLDYFKKEVKDVDFDERHSEVKRMLEQQKIKLENSTFQSEIDEVKIFSENAVKDFKHKLMLSFTNENYKTKTVGFMPTHYNYVLGLIEYENLYNSAKNKSDVFNYLSTLSKEEIEERIQGAEALKRLCEISIDYSKDGNWSVGNLPIEFESITKVDLFVENFIKSIEILAKEGKDVHQLIDLFIQTVKTNLENPLMEKNAKTNRHLFNRLEGVKLLLLNVKVLPPQQKQIQLEAKTFEEQELENNFTLSTIEDWLFEFKDKMTKTDYQTLVSALSHYFDNGSFPIISKPIQINGRINKKLFGWALNRIFEAKGKSVEKELLQFAKQNISLFIDVNFDENNIRKSNLYKYFTTKTQ